MLNEIETQAVSLSPAAAQAVQNILAERKLEGYALRVYVSNSSCCGVNLGMALDNTVRDTDKTFESNGVKLIVDDVSLNHLRGASIDYINDPERGNGFMVNGLNSGGCGQGEGDGCGGSCSCNN